MKLNFNNQANANEEELNQFGVGNFFRLNIGRKLMIGFGLFLFSILSFGLFIWRPIQKNKELNEVSAQVYAPSIDALKDLKFNVLSSQSLMGVWLTVDKDLGDEDAKGKRDLVQIHEYDYPKIKQDLRMLMGRWDGDDRLLMDSVFNRIDSLMAFEHELMVEFSESEVYWIPYENVDRRKVYRESLAHGPLSDKVINIVEGLRDVTHRLENKSRTYSHQMHDSLNMLDQLVWSLMILLFVVGITVAFFTIRSIVRPVSQLKDALLTMGQGVLPQSRVREGNDEIGQMSMALNNLISGWRRTSEFAKEIGEGNLKSEYEPLSEEDLLGNSLLRMREKLARVAEEEGKRSWSSEGLTMFSEVLRKNNDNMDALCRALISALVKYLNANQGGMFVLNNDGDEHFMELRGCYAWDRYKYNEEKIFLGEGLVGQVWQEKGSMYLTDIPEDYISIVSGLGEASPKNLLVVPMISNDTVFGVIELASFDEMDDYQVRFVERLAESIATTIAAVKVNERTKILLGRYEKASEQMKDKEEELKHSQIAMEEAQQKMSLQLESLVIEVQKHRKKEKLLMEENTMLQERVRSVAIELEEVKREFNLQ